MPFSHDEPSRMHLAAYVFISRPGRIPLLLDIRNVNSLRKAYSNIKKRQKKDKRIEIDSVKKKKEMQENNKREKEEQLITRRQH